MELTVDERGRIVIPESIREQFGIEPGSTLELEIERTAAGSESITIRLAGQEPVLERKGSLLVHTDQLTDPDFDVVEQLRRQRDERSRRHTGREEELDRPRG